MLLRARGGVRTNPTPVQGRVAAGTCVRLWPETQVLQPHTAPQIELDDLASAVLTLAAWGASTCESIAALPWLSPPPSHSLAEARDLLRGLGAVGDEGITAHGQALVRLPLHPRLGHMLLAARCIGPHAVSIASALAALIEERDILVNR